MIRPDILPDQKAVAAHYDELDRFYRDIWGVHVHHGLWQTGRETSDQAVHALVHHVARLAEVTKDSNICDIGCGYGGTARILARKFGARLTGVTLSQVQFDHALSASGADKNIHFIRGDWMQNTFPDDAFDVALAVESSEHMPDLSRFFRESFRILRPGGRLVLCAWLSRENPKRWEVDHLLEPICREGRLAELGTLMEYVAQMKAAGFSLVSVEDVSARVSKTWRLCAGRILVRLWRDESYRRFLFNASQSNRVFAFTVLRLWLAYKTGSVRYGIFKARKPISER